MRIVIYQMSLLFLGRASFGQGGQEEGLAEPISEEEIATAASLVEAINNLDSIVNTSDIRIPRSRNVLQNTRYWPNAVIPYTISSSFSNTERQVIAKAFGIYAEKTCIQFKGRTTESDYISIIRGGGCYSYVGLQGGSQDVSIGNGCARSVIVLHELMHAAGFLHEQSRSDRDQYVRINYDNVQSGRENNFRRENTNNLNAAYDYCSIMHYSAYAFSNNGQPTISVLRDTGDCVIGQQSTFSDTDIRMLNTLYQCTGYPQVGSGTTTTASTTTQSSTTTVSTTETTSGSTGTTSATTSSGSTTTGSCQDLNSNCAYWAERGFCSGRYEEYMKRTCPKACSICGEGTTTTITTVNSSIDCPEFSLVDLSNGLNSKMLSISKTDLFPHSFCLTEPHLCPAFSFFLKTYS